jgi:hypothetical protein
MPEREALVMWRSRLRWRLSGAWMWPTFAVLTALDAVILSRLPFSGGRANLLGCLLAAGFLNVIVVAAVPPLGGALVRRRRPQLPREIAADRAGTVGLVVLALVLLAGGLAHRGGLHRNDREAGVAIATATRYAAHHAPARYLPLHDASTVQQDAHLFRVCFPGPDPRRDFCVFVFTDQDIPVLRPDQDQRPNNTISGSDNPGRSGA